MAKAVEDDALLIGQAMNEEHRARTDRTLAFRITSEESGEDLVEAPDTEESDEQQQQEWAFVPDTHPDEDVVAGPSSPYVLQQTGALEPFPSRSSNCLACKEVFPPHQLVRLSMRTYLLHRMPHFVVHTSHQRRIVVSPALLSAEHPTDADGSRTIRR